MSWSNHKLRVMDWGYPTTVLHQVITGTNLVGLIREDASPIPLRYYIRSKGYECVARSLATRNEEPNILGSFLSSKLGVTTYRPYEGVTLQNERPMVSTLVGASRNRQQYADWAGPLARKK